MSRIKNIRYAFNNDCQEFISEYEGQAYIPVIDYENIGKDGNFTGPLPLLWEKVYTYDLRYDDLTWTKKVPLGVKNFHRAAWGLKPLTCNHPEERQKMIKFEDGSNHKICKRCYTILD